MRRRRRPTPLGPVAGLSVAALLIVAIGGPWALLVVASAIGVTAALAGARRWP